MPVSTSATATAARTVQFRDTPPKSSYGYEAAVSVDHMKHRSEKAGLRLRRRGDDVLGLFVDVSPDVQEHLAYLAETLNVPKWAVVEAAVRATTLETVEREFPEAFTDDELELPINVAA